MNEILVDTTIWSLALHRRAEQLAPLEIQQRQECFRIVRMRLGLMIGPVRQELLSGVKDPVQFDSLRARVSPLIDLPLAPADFELAADVSNKLNWRGIAVSPVDPLLCAVSIDRALPIFTADRDFSRIIELLPIRLHTL